ncbi:hypothetical protein F4604DRAFT_1689715 [Suillus subluteus]|nr:hypothetical protein F4604DRAFT_1689715 [Suillus subluteus]
MSWYEFHTMHDTGSIQDSMLLDWAGGYQFKLANLSGLVHMPHYGPGQCKFRASLVVSISSYLIEIQSIQKSVSIDWAGGYQFELTGSSGLVHMPYYITGQCEFRDGWVVTISRWISVQIGQFKWTSPYAILYYWPFIHGAAKKGEASTELTVSMAWKLLKKPGFKKYSSNDSFEDDNDCADIW